MSTKESKPMEVRNDADLQAIQTSVAFKNISDAVEQYRRQFGLAFLALIAFSAIHVGLVVIANLYTMQTRIVGQTMTVAGDETAPVGTAQVVERRSLSYVMTNLAEEDQITSLRSMKSVSFVDQEDNFRQYTVTGFQLGGWKRSELKLYTSVGHVLEYVRGKGVRVFSEDSTTACNSTGSDSRKLLSWTLAAPPPSPPPPPYSTIAEQMAIDCNVLAVKNGFTSCDDDHTVGMSYDTFTGIDAQAGATGSWEHNKGLYNQAQWLNQLIDHEDDDVYDADNTIVTIDVVTGATSSVSWADDDSGSSKYSGLVTSGAAATLFSGSNQWGTTSKVTSNLSNLKGFAGNLAGYATSIIADECDESTGELVCDHIGVQSSIASKLDTDSYLSSIESDSSGIKHMFEHNSGFAKTHQVIPGLKIAYNYGAGSQVYTDDDAEVAKVTKGLGTNYWEGASAQWEKANSATYDSQARMYDTYVLQGASASGEVGTFVAAQEKAFSQTNADSVWGESIWGTDVASAYIAGYPGTAHASYGDIEGASEAEVGKALILDAIGDFAKATEVIEDIWGNFKSRSIGYSGLSRAQMTANNDHLSYSYASSWSLCAWNSGCSGSVYGCSGSGALDLSAFNSPIFYWAYTKCEEITAGESSGGTSMLGVDGVSNALGGVFFSATLGGYESYAVYLPPKFCHIMNAADMEAAEGAMDDAGNQMEFVFMLHGWGGHCDFIDGIAMVMDDVFSSCSESELTAGTCSRTVSNPTTSETSVLAAMNGFVVFAPEDGSTPYGTKTWYQDNEFTGKHQNFLQSELVTTADSLLQVSRRTIGLFGFSQGGVGSILMSLGSTVYSGIASFNGPLMPAECFFMNECHQECGVDFIMCELLWSSVLVAMMPYVTVKKNYMMHSSGTTDPMDQGTCNTLKIANHAKCVKGNLNGVWNTLLMWQYIWIKNVYGGPSYSRRNGTFRYCPAWRKAEAGNQCSLGNFASTGTLSSDYYYPEYWGNTWGAVSYYYLNPKYFIMAVQHFIPTHNIMTSEAYKDEFQKFLGRTPFFRLWETPTAYYDTGGSVALSLLVSVDADDEFGLLKSTQAYSWLLLCDGSILAGFDGVWAYDNPSSSDQQGHAYNYHDTVLTIQWFSEVFRSFSAPTGLSSSIKDLYTAKGAAEPDFDEFGVSSTLELMGTMEYSTCYVFQLNVGVTGQSSGQSMASKISAPTEECSQANDVGKSMLYPALDISAFQTAAEVEKIEDSNDHAGLHGDLAGYKERHENSSDTTVYSCYMATTSAEAWSEGGGTDSFITRIFDCNMYSYKHQDNGVSFGSGDSPSGMACDFSTEYPIDYDPKSSGSGASDRTEAYAECDNAFPTM